MKHERVVNPCHHCPERGCGHQAQCERYMKFFEENRRRDQERANERVANYYTVESIQRVKSGTRSNMKKFRPKGWEQ